MNRTEGSVLEFTVCFCRPIFAEPVGGAMRLRIGVICAIVLGIALAAGPLKADSVAIQNASFETTNPLTFGGCGTGCAYNYGPIPDWTLNGRSEERRVGKE